MKKELPSPKKVIKMKIVEIEEPEVDEKGKPRYAILMGKKVKIIPEK